MTLYPDVQKKAQSELDVVVGRKRLADASDEEGLPYTSALVKEVLRWTPLYRLGCRIGVV
jgi:cytochrome P450